MSIILLWQILGFSMQFPQTVSSDPTGSSDPSMSINFQQLGSANPSQSNSHQALPETIPGWPHTFNDHILEAMINSTSELNHLSP